MLKEKLIKNRNFRIFLFSVIVCLVIGLVIVSTNDLQEDTMEEEKETEAQYLGPVPEGCDEQYFRKTGITKPLEKE